MVFRILGKAMSFGDLLTLVIILLAPFLSAKILFVAAGYLIVKGAVFGIGGNFVSWLDVLCGCYVLLIAFGITFQIATIISVLFLAQKAAFGLLL